MYAIDIETVDPNIKKLGDGSMRKDGHILGIGVYGDGSFGKIEEYFNPDDPKLKEILADTSTAKVFHNGVYDTTWIVNGHGLTLNGKIEDTMTREVLINEYSPGFGLDESCLRRGVTGKNKGDTIDAYWRQMGGKGKAIEHLNEIPREIVGKYCMQDCKATYDLFYAQQKLIEQYDLQKVNDVEANLYPLLIEMKRNGIRINIDRRDELSYEFMNKAADLRCALEEQYGIENINSTKQVADMMHRLGFTSTELTSTGNESWGADVLDSIDHPAAKLLSEAKLYSKLYSTFLKGYFTECAVGDRIYPTFYPALRDEGGTITGRFSSRNPNLQNIPGDDRKKGNLIRSILIPEDDCILCAFDYKQIEYTLFIHYAIGPQAEQARQHIRDGADYHSMAQKLMKWDTEERQKALGLTKHDARKMTKNFNFGSIYGLSRNGFKKKFRHLLMQGAVATGQDFDTYADNLYREYFRMLPFVKPTCEGIKSLCMSKGFMRSIGGRMHRTPERTGLYAIVNYVCQGGASDILKAGLSAAWDAGVFKYLKMHITVHDENVFSVPRTKASIEAAKEFSHIMSNTIQLKVPIRVDEEAGFNWADCDSEHWVDWCKNI